MNHETWISKELQRIRDLDDKKEQGRLFDLFDDIIEKRNDYISSIYKYKTERLYEDMYNRGIKFEKSDIKLSELKSMWDDKFTKGLSMKDKAEIYFDSFMWHTFSYEKREAQKGSKARQAFNRVKKTKVYGFFQEGDEAFCISNAKLLRSSDLNHLNDVYIFDPDMKWTYIHTHELQCGPYFTRS